MNICVDLDIDDIIWEMSKSDRRNMLVALLSEINEKDFKEVLDSLKTEKITTLVGIQNVPNNYNDFDISVMSLVGKSWRLTVEDERTITSIANLYS